MSTEPDRADEPAADAETSRSPRAASAAGQARRSNIAAGRLPDLEALRKFIVVAEELSFTRAARRLHVVQSGVSTAVAGLERELGAELFDRDRHTVTLTEAGRVLLPEARATLAAARGAVEAVAEATAGLRGELSVGTMISTGAIDVPGLLGRFHETHPAVLVRLRVLPGGSAAAGLGAGRGARRRHPLGVHAGRGPRFRDRAHRGGRGGRPAPAPLSRRPGRPSRRLCENAGFSAGWRVATAPTPNKLRWGMTYPEQPVATTSGPLRPDASQFWAGGAATAVVAALIALVGILIVRWTLGIPILAPAGDGAWGNAHTVEYCIAAAGAALVATGLLYLLIISTPRPGLFFSWIMVLVTLAATVYPFSSGAPLSEKFGTAIVNLALGVAITSLLQAVASRAVRGTSTVTYRRGSMRGYNRARVPRQPAGYDQPAQAPQAPQAGYDQPAQAPQAGCDQAAYDRAGNDQPTDYAPRTRIEPVSSDVPPTRNAPPPWE